MGRAKGVLRVPGKTFLRGPLATLETPRGYLDGREGERQGGDMSSSGGDQRGLQRGVPNYAGTRDFPPYPPLPGLRPAKEIPSGRPWQGGGEGKIHRMGREI